MPLFPLQLSDAGTAHTQAVYPCRRKHHHKRHTGVACTHLHAAPTIEPKD